MPIRIVLLVLGASFLCSLLAAAEFDLVALVSTGHHHHDEPELDELVFLSALFSAVLGILLAWKVVALGRERRCRRAIEKVAALDGLTSLANRRSFVERLQHAFDGVAAGRPCAVLLIDLDGFKAINDTYGHAAGDRILMHVAEQLARLARGKDLAARLGGDEFAMLLEGASAAPDRAAALVESIRATVQQPLLCAGESLRVGVSIGLALPSARTSSAAALLEAADSAMYADKVERQAPGRRAAA